MRIRVNGLEEEIAGVLTIADLLARRGTDARYVVVAVNESCVPRAQLAETQLASGDAVEILSPMQGG